MAIENRQDLVGLHGLIRSHQQLGNSARLIGLDQGVVSSGAHNPFGSHGLLKRQDAADQQDCARCHQHAMSDCACPRAWWGKELIGFCNHQRPSTGLNDGVIHEPDTRKGETCRFLRSWAGWFCTFTWPDSR